jgi:hypothetical protein
MESLRRGSIDAAMKKAGNAGLFLRACRCDQARVSRRPA